VRGGLTSTPEAVEVQEVNIIVQLRRPAQKNGPILSVRSDKFILLKHWIFASRDTCRSHVYEPRRTRRGSSQEQHQRSRAKKRAIQDNLPIMVFSPPA